MPDALEIEFVTASGRTQVLVALSDKALHPTPFASLARRNRRG